MGRGLILLNPAGRGARWPVRSACRRAGSPVAAAGPPAPGRPSGRRWVPAGPAHGSRACARPAGRWRCRCAAGRAPSPLRPGAAVGAARGGPAASCRSGDGLDRRPRPGPSPPPVPAARRAALPLRGLCRLWALFSPGRGGGPLPAVRPESSRPGALPGEQGPSAKGGVLCLPSPASVFACF